MPQTETVQRWDARTHTYSTVTVTVAAPRRRTARRPARRAPRIGTPRASMAGLLPTSPLATVGHARLIHALREPLADMRTYLPAPAIKTHRAPAVFPSAT